LSEYIFAIFAIFKVIFVAPLIQFVAPSFFAFLKVRHKSFFDLKEKFVNAINSLGANN
jgi:hypothetical protein